MPGDTPPPEPEQEQEQDETDTDFVEVDPTGRYGRYSEVLGKGAFKTVYKAFDELEGIEVAWNQVKLADVLRNSDDLERLYSEVHLLKTLKHKNIIKFYTSWVDTINNNINLITEVFTSGTLRQYRKKHKHVDTRALKNWSRQILSGLLYLHSHDPPVIHRDLKCDNIFVNGNQGMVKVGDLGLAAILHHAQLAHSVIGTPEFMAPELYEEEYNELVDVYAFGMSLLELVTFEYPYAECSNAAQIYKKVISGIKPASLAKVKDPAVRQFIEKCIANVSERLSARELLRDPFLCLDVENESIGYSLPRELNHVDNVGHPNARTNNTYNNESYMNGRDFTLEGQRKDINTIFLKLHIADSTGQFHNLHFPFNIEDDTSISVATEMVAELDLADRDVTTIAEIIDLEIQAHTPEWVPGEALEDHDNEVTVQDKYDLEAEDEISTLANESNHPSGGLVLERLSSGRKYWSDSPKGTGTDSPSRLALSNFSSEINSHDSDDLSFDACEKIDRSFKHDDRCDYCSYGTSASKQKKGSTYFIGHGEDNLESITLSASLELPSLVRKYMGNHNQEEECSFKYVNNKNRSIADEHEGDDGSLYKTILENEPKNVKSAAKKLKHILVEQQKELEELKKKHEMAISDIVKELPPELRKRTLSILHLKIPDYKMDLELEEHPGHSAFSVSSLLEALPSYTDKSLMDNASKEI